MILVPIMSEGMRSGVNCTRENFRFTASASVRTSMVLPKPGTPSSRTCPGGKERDQNPFDNFGLADDHAREFVADAAKLRAELFDLLLGIGGGHGKGKRWKAEGRRQPSEFCAFFSVLRPDVFKVAPHEVARTERNVFLLDGILRARVPWPRKDRGNAGWPWRDRRANWTSSCNDAPSPSMPSIRWA